MHRFMLVAVTSLLAALCGVSSNGAVLVGAHVDSNLGNSPASFVALESKIGRQLAIDSDSASWAAFPDTPRIKWDLQTGRMPMQSWLVLFQEANPNACATAAAINAGTYDTQLAQQAATVKALGGTILVRFNYEMTDNLENTCFTGFPIANNMALAGQEFISAWKHVVGIFRAAGASNVKWVWAPGAPAYATNVWRLFYPGADYVDWIGMDDFNQVDTPVSFAIDPGVAQFDADVTPLGKPMMISANAAFDDPTLDPDPQTMWIETARAYMKAHPEISAYVYWDGKTQITLPPPPYSGAGYVLTGSGLTAFKAMANDPYFGGP
jgi:hypothetical protein